MSWGCARQASPRPTRVVLLGPPGSGKSTQAERLARHLGVMHVATGALLRREVASSSALGRAVAPTLEQGDLVADDLVDAIVIGGIKQAVDSSGGYVLDGFPRNLAQAEVLAALAPRGLDAEAVLYLEVGAETCRERLLARTVREGRSDDTPETIERRLELYEDAIAPVRKYYERAGILVTLDAEGGPDMVAGRLLERLDLR